MSTSIRPIGSPFKTSSNNYRPSTVAGRLINGETTNMAKTNPTQPATTPVPPAPAGKVRTAFGTVTDPALLPAAKVTEVDSEDGLPPVKLSDILDGQPFDPVASKSPDTTESHTAEPPRDETSASAVNTSSSHWSRIPAQMKQFTDFVAGLLNDYALFDRDERGDLKDWTVDSYLDKRSVDLSFYPTFTAARKSLDEMLLGEFKDDLKAILIEKKCPKDMLSPLALIGHETIEDGIRAMTGKGVRDAITGKMRSLEQAQEIEQTNAAMSRTVAEQKAQDAQNDVPQPSALAGNPFKPAERGKVYVKMGIAGISGSGKTYTALKVARDMFPKGRIAMLCTEHGAAKLYAPYFKFDLVDLTDYNPRQFIQYIKAAVSYGYDALVIDSLTAEWEGDGGILSIADGKFGGWKTATPLHQEVISTIQDAQIHIFCTMLSKMGYDQSKDERGKAVVTKTGMEPKQRKDIEGEFHMFAEMDDSNGLIIVKSRCLDIKAKTPFPKGDGLATLLTKWIA